MENASVLRDILIKQIAKNARINGKILILKIESKTCANSATECTSCYDA